jgi:SAM-dependent methyltransferase
VDEAMEAEFDTVAGWTADVALDLGDRYHVPAACRGSGSPAVLSWLIDALQLSAADRMLDCGAGVGGPAAFAADRVGVHPVLTDPEFGACRAARRLFGLPALQAGSDLPLGPDTFDVVWSLGVLCTVPDQRHLLTELRRVTRRRGRLGLLVFVRTAATLPEQPEGNNFPSAAELDELLATTGWAVSNRRSTADLPSAEADWQQLADEVDAELERRHSGDPVWQTAAQQSAIIGRLLGSGQLIGELVIAVPS